MDTQSIFTAEQRIRLRAELLERAAHDPRISGAAITGSAAAGNEDRWSDIDLAFGVAEGNELMSVVADWSEYMYEQQSAVHHVDVKAGAWIYRVFLLPSTLQVDLAFVPATEFRPLGPTFQLVFGKAKEPQPIAPQSHADIIGMSWLYALHARSSIARGRLWQAEYMISGVRDHVLALACLRHGLPAAHGRGLDRLPLDVAGPLEDSLARKLDTAELSRAFSSAVNGLLTEIHILDERLAERLEPALMRLTEKP